MRIQEQPWHLRRATAKDELRFLWLEELHQLTLAWTAEFAIDVIPVLESWDLTAILDDTHPSDALARLDAKVWNHQAAILSTLLKTSKLSEIEATLTSLDQISWKEGRRCAESRIAQGLRFENRADLRTLFLAIGDTPMSGDHFSDAFLVIRSVESRVEVELRECPHQRASEDVKRQADELCRMHGNWMRGFAYGLNNAVTVETTQALPRCKQIWYLLTP